MINDGTKKIELEYVKIYSVGGIIRIDIHKDAYKGVVSYEEH